ncbi:MAG: hypothetical protein TREMPRED_005075 [Tremellales sp. Tagirdzhanova-0007]|nr:MAG: hypothetical protein TREMPRED_005075 [Tremellales sp. Tagirdzhanova-0007]
MSDPQASSSRDLLPTILDHLNTLQHSHHLANPQLNLPYLHPFAQTSSWKGKDREISLSSSTQLDLLKELRGAVEMSRSLLRQPETDHDRDWAKLARALKEIVTHQSAILPISRSLSPLPVLRRIRPLLVTSLVLLTPVELLTTLARALSIQTYLEDSQFGLLKTSLTLAGNRFVVDVDLETDAAGNDDDDDYIDIEKRMEGRGRLRLSKLTANHVGPGGSTGKSESIAAVLRERFEAFLDSWNEGEKGRRLEKLIRDLEDELQDLKVLDDVVARLGEEAGPGLFADLEEVVSKVKGSPLFHHSDHSSIFPRFRLLDSSTSNQNPIFRIRPLRPGETVPVPSLPAENMIVDEEQWLGGCWILEQRWLSRPASEQEEAQSVSWNTGTKIEQLILNQQPTSRLDQDQASTGSLKVPYTLDHTVSPEPSKGESASLRQHWSMAQPGPEGYLITSVGVPSIWVDFRGIIEALRGQIVLNQLFLSIYRTSLLERGHEMLEGNDSDDEESFEELNGLMDAPTAIPLSIRLRQDSIRITLPHPHTDDPATLTLNISPCAQTPYYVDISCQVVQRDMVSEQLEGKVALAVEAGRSGGRDLVDIVARTERALRHD